MPITELRRASASVVAEPSNPITALANRKTAPGLLRCNGTVWSGHAPHKQFRTTPYESLFLTTAYLITVSRT